MKIKKTRYSKSVLALILAMCMLMSCLYVGLVPTDASVVHNEEQIGAVANDEQVGALSVAGKIYFIKPDDWSYAALVIGHSSYSDCYQMSNISGTKLYYVKRDSAWNDSTEFAFFDVNGWGSEGNSISSRSSYATHSSTVNSSYAMNAGSTYLIPTTENSPTYYSTGYSAMNATLTIKTMIKSDSSYAETTTKYGTFSASDAKELNGDGSSTSSSISQTNGTATLSTARTNTATISQSAVSGYTFKGWKTSKDTTGSDLSTGNYSFTNSGSATTIYAYYAPSSTPAASSVSLSSSPSSGTIYAGETEVTYTATATGAQSGVTYNFKVDGTTVQNSTSNTYKRTFSSAGTYSVTVTVQKSGYDDVTSSAVSTTVVNRPVYYLLGQKNDYDWVVKDANKMTYNSSTGLYEITRNLYQGVAHYGGTDTSNPSDTGFKVYSSDGTYYGSSSGYNINGMSYNNTTLSSSGSSHNVCLTTKDLSSVTNNKVPYKFTYNTSDKKVTVYYPMKVTFNMNGHGNATSSQVVAYNGTVTEPTTAPTATGYTFGGWYKESSCTNAWNFATDTVTADKTLYAKWTVKSHTITYPSTNTGYTLGGTKPSSANYGATVSFTAAPQTGYRISKVTYTPAGGTETDCSAGSNNEYHFQMPDSDVTISITAVRTYTVTLVTYTKDINDNALSADAGFATLKYKIGSGIQTDYTSAITNVDEGSTVTFTVTYKAGYEFKSVTGATKTNSTTFTVSGVNSNTTVTLTAKEISRTVQVKYRYYKQDNTYTTTDAYTISNVGVVTSGTVSAVTNPTSTNGDYSFDKFSLDAGITGTPNGASTFTIKANTSANSTNTIVYIDYKEILYNLTVVAAPEGSGTVKEGNTVRSGTTIQVGNVTGITLTAAANDGYKFTEWTQTANATTTPTTVQSTTYTIRIKGDTTLTANFEEITHTITLKKRIYLVEEGANPVLLKEDTNGILFSGAGKFTTIYINAPKVHNCSFMTFDLNGKESIITLVNDSKLTDSSIEVNAEDDAVIYADYKVSGNVDIYVDMNDNVGTPILNLKYFVNSSGDPVPYTSVDANGYPVQPAGSTPANLPLEMELVTGSESIYRYTLKIPKLRDDYYIGAHSNEIDIINISYITVENQRIGESTGFKIDKEAYTTGEMWLKADSTNLKTFKTLSYGSVTNSFLGLIGDGSLNANHTLLNSAVQRVQGTAIHTDDDEIYHAQYAGLYQLNNTLVDNFHYTLKVSVNNEVTQNGTTYYFDKWIKCPVENLTYSAGGYSFSSKTAVETEYSSSDLSFTKAPDSDGGDYAYIALYKPVSSSDSTVRVEITYKFKDFDSSDGNYIYEEGKTVETSYTKTVKINVGAGKSYEDFSDVNTAAALNSIANANAPFVASNYFDYEYKADSVVVDNKKTDSNSSKIVITAELTEKARIYTIIVKDGDDIADTKTGNYMQTKVLTTTKSNPVWKDSSGQILATGSSYKARFVSSGNEKNGSTDCQIIKLESQSDVSVEHKSVVSNAFTEKYYSGDTEMLSHNFYIIDYCAEGELLGGGVLYATTENGAYRQTNAATYLGAYASPTDQASITARTNFITDILKAGTQTIDYSTEYKAQSINNVGFRYKPYKNTEDVFRYSDELHAYLTVFEGTNVNSPNYNRQKLRLFSFMVYKSGNNTVIVPSEGYAEVDRYKEG